MTQNKKGTNKKRNSEEILKENEKRIQEIATNHPECSGTPIYHFDEEYHFLSNFFEQPVTVDGYSFQNGESAFQGFKDMNRIHEFAELKPGKAKRLGRKVSLRSDWEEIKVDVMKNVVFSKFSQNEELKKQLLETNDRLLIEGNWWGDTTWGVSGGKGKNHLGEILMKVREELREQ